LTIGLKTCSPPLFHSEFFHSEVGVLNLIVPKNITDMSQKRPIRLVTLNILPFIMVITLSAVSESTRIGLFVMKPHLESMCFVLSEDSMFVHDLFFRYLHLHVDERKTDKSLSYKPAEALSLYDGEDEIMVMMYDKEQPRVHIPVEISLTPAARLSHTACSHSTNMSDDPPNLAYILSLPFR
jgi:hypothetical protein